MNSFKKSNNLKQLERQIEQKNKSLNVININEHPSITEIVVLKQELRLFKVLSEGKIISNDISKKRVATISLRISLDTQTKLKTLTKSGLVSQADVVTMMIEKLYEEAINGEPDNI